MNRSTLQNAGFCTQYVHSLRELIDRDAGFNSQDLARTLAAFQLSEIRRPQPASHSHDPAESQIVAVYAGLLQRGLPTFPSLLVERTLLQPCIEQGLAVDASDAKAGSIRYTLPDGGRNVPQKWLEALARAHVAVDPRMTPLDLNADRFGSTEEHEFFRFTLAEAVGKGPIQLFELQRDFSALLPNAQTKGYIDQRVDFAVSGPGWKLVIEVDGAQHGELAQSAGDKRRDEQLRQQGWSVVRVPTGRLRADATIDTLRRTMPANNFVRYAALNHSSPLWQDPLGRLALQVVLAPFAVARIEHALLQALANGALSLSQGRWRLVIVERDVRAGILAVVDFVDHLHAFSDLHKLDRQLPAVDLLVYHTQEFPADAAELLAQKLRNANIQVRQAELGKVAISSERGADLLVDVAVLQRDGYNDRSRELADRHLSVTGAAYIIRSAYHDADTRRIASLDPITYPIETIQVQTRDGRQRQEVDERARRALVFLLQNIFRKQEFRDGQLPIIGRALRRQPVIGLLPTGAGKSLCYQFAALLQPGMTIVVDPLISLMTDQVDNLRSGAAIDWIGEINSLRSVAEKSEIINVMAEGRVKLLFLSPERLQSRAFRNKLSEFSLAYPVAYGVIDEAHCVSEWGHDFRTSYLRVAKTIKEYCRHNHAEPTLIALTGTASFAVLSDVQRELEVDDEHAQVYPDSFDRQELHYRVVKTLSSQKQQQLLDLLYQRLPSELGMAWSELYQRHGEATKAGIIFTPHAKGAFGAVAISEVLYGKLNVPVKFYTGKTDGSQKEMTQREFKNNDFALLVATKAFGMGIDKPNVRYTVHYNIPPSLEAFYQEAGRAGRDCEDAFCWLLFSDDRAAEADLALAPDAQDTIVHQIANNKVGGDAHRLLRLHTNSFRGLTPELDTIKDLYKQFIGPDLKGKAIDRRHELIVPFTDRSDDEHVQMQRDKALYRLAVLGIVVDYTLDWGKQLFEVVAARQSDEQLIRNLQGYVRRYKTREFVEAVPARVRAEPGDTVLGQCASFLLHFVYEEIEKKRRAAIRSIMEVARKASSLPDSQQQDFYVRGELATYLEKSPFTDVLLTLARAIHPSEWLAVLHMRDDNGVPLLSTVDGVRQLIGGCRRTLESYLEHPGLLFLSSVGWLLLPDPDVDQAMDEARRAFRSVSAQGPHPDQAAITLMLQGYRAMLRNVANGSDLFRRTAAVALRENPTRSLARELYRDIPKESEAVIYNFLLQEIRGLNQHLSQ